MAAGSAAIAGIDEVTSRFSGRPSLRQRLAELLGFGIKRTVSNKVEAIAELKSANHILNLPLQSQERYRAEENYVADANTLTKIDRGFEIITDWRLRTKLLDERWKMRMESLEEETGLRKLTPEEIAWAKENKVHPEVLAICTDSYFKALNSLQEKLKELGRAKFMGEFRPDVVDAYERDELPSLDIPLEQMLPSPGTMVGIVMNETKAGISKEGGMYGFAFIGTKPALSQISIKDPDIMARVKTDLKSLINALSEGQHAYKVENIPGSDKSEDPTEEIGGDIGMQFRPDTAWELYKRLKKDFGISFNPFSLEAPVAAFLMLFRGERLGNGEYRYGYLRGDYILKTKKGVKINVKEAFRKDSLSRWNRKLAENNLSWGESYSKKFIPGFLEKVIAPKHKANATGGGASPKIP